MKAIKFKSSKADGNCYVLFVVNRDCLDKGDKIDSSRNQMIMDKVIQVNFDRAGIKKRFDLRGEIQKSSEDHPLRKAYEINHIYFTNFEDAMHLFEDNLSKKEYRSILDKLMIGKKYVHDKYIQEASEITVLAYILKHFNKSFCYEPKYNGGSNPECSFEFQGKTINVEVKCPNLEKWIQAEERNTVKIDFVERVPDHTEIADDISKIVIPNLKTLNYDGIEVIPRFDNKLKDYLVGAHKKFPVSDDSNFNILIISLDIPSDMDKWYGYIMGENGALTGNTYISEEYKNVDAIVFTNIVNGHTGWCVHNTNVWDMRQYINIMFLNLDRQETETGRFFFREVNGLFGPLTKAFNDYLEEMDRETKNDKDYMEYKIKEIGIISDFVNKLISGEIKI